MGKRLESVLGKRLGKSSRAHPRADCSGRAMPRKAMSAATDDRVGNVLALERIGRAGLLGQRDGVDLLRPRGRDGRFRRLRNAQDREAAVWIGRGEKASETTPTRD